MTKVASISFESSGFGGIPEASLSYESGKETGYIWLVERIKGRDCKGQWYLDKNNTYVWELKCLDGLSASGEISNPLNDIGTGKGIDSENHKIKFSFKSRN